MENVEGEVVEEVPEVVLPEEIVLIAIVLDISPEMLVSA